VYKKPTNRASALKEDKKRRIWISNFWNSLKKQKILSKTFDEASKNQILWLKLLEKLKKTHIFNSDFGNGQKKRKILTKTFDEASKNQILWLKLLEKS